MGGRHKSGCGSQVGVSYKLGVACDLEIIQNMSGEVHEWVWWYVSEGSKMFVHECVVNLII